LGSEHVLVAGAKLTWHLPATTSHTALLQLGFFPAGRLHWLFWMQLTQAPLLLHTPRTDMVTCWPFLATIDVVTQAAPTRAREYRHLFVTKSQTLLLQLPVTPAGKLHWLS
jgi:hypothetical protein